MRTIRRILLRVCVAVLCIAALAYLADDLWARFRGRPTEQMKVDRYYAMINRWNETEYSTGTPIVQTCVDAMLPHFGYVPCWYLRQHTLQQVKIN